MSNNDKRYADHSIGSCAEEWLVAWPLRWMGVWKSCRLSLHLSDRKDLREEHPRWGDSWYILSAQTVGRDGTGLG